MSEFSFSDAISATRRARDRDRVFILVGMNRSQLHFSLTTSTFYFEYLLWQWQLIATDDNRGVVINQDQNDNYDAEHCCRNDRK